MPSPKPLATRVQLERRVGPIVEDDEINLADHMLEYASAQARQYGWSFWEPFNVPDSIRFVVIEAAARGYYNPAGYKLERGDELTLQRDDESSAGATFTKAEIALCRAASFQSGVVSVQLLRPDQVTDQVIVGGSTGGGGVDGTDISFG